MDSDEKAIQEGRKLHGKKNSFDDNLCSLLVLLFGCPQPAAASDAIPIVPYTLQEKEMLGYIVQQEAGGYDLEHKQAIVQVILNRVRSEAFPDTIYGVLTQANQFSSLSNWYSRRNPPDSVTLKAVETVLKGEYIDMTKGATFFYAPRWAGSASNWFETSLQYLFTLDGHRFFKAA